MSRGAVAPSPPARAGVRSASHRSGKEPFEAGTGGDWWRLTCGFAESSASVLERASLDEIESICGWWLYWA